MVTNQIVLSINVHAAWTNGDFAYLQQRGIAPMPWSPLAGGRLWAEASETLRLLPVELAGTDWTAVAVAWLLHHPASIVPVLDTKSLALIAAISETLRMRLQRYD